MMEQQDSALTFPCQFPVKVMGPATDAFEHAVLGIFRRHVPDLSEGAVKRRESAANKYASLTVTITATGKTQLDAIYQELNAHELVLMTL